MSDKKITAEQKAYLQSLTCQRLSDEEGNRELARIFRNDENSMLPDALRKGWNEDKQDEKAFYIIKDKNNQPLLFFTLVCGVVYIPIFYQKVYEEFKRAEALFFAAREKTVTQLRARGQARLVQCSRRYAPPERKKIPTREDCKNHRRQGEIDPMLL